MNKIRTKLLLFTLLSNISMAKVDFEVLGEAVAYYQTNNEGDHNFFSQQGSQGDLGLQLEVKAAVDNGFHLAYQGAFLGTLGLEDSILSNAQQYARKNNSNAFSTTKMYFWKRFAKTSFKLGRQELSQEISPLAFSESWNVFKNTFDALVMRNEDLKETTFVAAYIVKGNEHNDLNTFSDLYGRGQNVDGSAYLLTVLNRSLEEVPMRGSYYFLKDLNKKEGASVFWFDVKSEKNVVDMAFQTAYIYPSDLSKTLLLGAKVSTKYNRVGLSLAYSYVSSGGLSFQNMGTQGNVAFYTQMLNNQNFIALDAQTTVLKTDLKLPMGNLTFGYGVTQDKSVLKNDFSELNIVYKFNLLRSKMFVGYIRQDTKFNSFNGEDSSSNIRIWSRYTF